MTELVLPQIKPCMGLWSLEYGGSDTRVIQDDCRPRLPGFVCVWFVVLLDL
jgi:hypothetical protein